MTSCSSFVNSADDSSGAEVRVGRPGDAADETGPAGGDDWNVSDDDGGSGGEFERACDGDGGGGGVKRTGRPACA
jgi:hypothetical protein